MATLMQRLPRIRFCALLIICLLALGALVAARPVVAAPFAQGQVPLDAACKPTDLVVLIDQSDSMRRNDPNDERFVAANTIVNFLGNHAVWLCQGQNITHRIAVIGFGDNPVQTINSGVPNLYTDDIATYIADQRIPPRNTFDEWKTDRDGIESSINAANGQYLGATDHHSALEAARERLNFWKANPLDDRARRQSVVLITDGEPCMFAFGCPYPPNPQDMNAIDVLTNPLGNTFPWRGADNADSVFISLIAMSQGAQSWQENIFSRWRTIAQAHGGDVFSANDLNTNLSTIVTDIIAPVAGSAMDAVTCDQEFWIYPYTDNLVLIYALGLDPLITNRATVVIDTLSEQIMVQGGTATSGVVTIQDYVEDEGNEYYVFQRPLPGRYRLNYGGLDSCAGQMDVRVGKRAVTGEALIPAAGATYPAIDPPSAIAAEKFRVAAYEAVGEDEETEAKAPLIEIDGYPLDVTATVTSTDGNYSHTYNFNKTENGIYESTEVIASPTVGDYTWEVVAMVRNPDPAGAPIEVFRDSGAFTASEVTPFGFAISRPVEGALVPLNTVSGAQQLPVAIPVAIDLVDGDGNPVNVDAYLTDGDGLFTASLLRGDTVVETVTLTRTPGSQSEFAGEFTNSDGGNVLVPGDYTIEVEAAWSPDRYNALAHLPATEHAAVGLSQFEVVPLELRITPPEDTTVHEANWLGALRGRVQPVDFYIEVVNAVTQDLMPLTQVLRDPDADLQAAIVPPSGNPSVAPLTVLSNENFQRLVAENVAGDSAESGDYQIKLDTAAIPLQDNFAWAGDEAVATFARQDTTFSSPTVWRAIAGVTAALLLALLAWIIYSLTGGPTGQLALVSTGTGRASEIAAFPLRSMPRVNRVRNATLASLGVKEIRVRRGPRDEDGLGTVYTSATDAEGAPLLVDATMTENVSEAFLPDAELVYRTR